MRAILAFLFLTLSSATLVSAQIDSSGARHLADSLRSPLNANVRTTSPCQS